MFNEIFYDMNLTFNKRYIHACIDDLWHYSLLIFKMSALDPNPAYVPSAFM